MVELDLMIKAIIFDYGRTIIEPETDNLFPEARGILENLIEKNLKLALVSRSHHPKNRWRNIKRLELEKYFSPIEVISAENTKDYRSILRKLQVKGGECLVIGDQVKNDILPGNKIGATTVWLRKGKFAGLLPTSKEERPDYTVTLLEELVPIVDSLI